MINTNDIVIESINILNEMLLGEVKKSSFKLLKAIVKNLKDSNDIDEEHLKNIGFIRQEGTNLYKVPVWYLKSIDENDDIDLYDSNKNKINLDTFSILNLDPKNEYFIKIGKDSENINSDMYRNILMEVFDKNKSIIISKMIEAKITNNVIKSTVNEYELFLNNLGEYLDSFNDDTFLSSTVSKYNENLCITEFKDFDKMYEEYEKDKNSDIDYDSIPIDTYLNLIYNRFYEFVNVNNVTKDIFSLKIICPNNTLANKIYDNISLKYSFDNICVYGNNILFNQNEDLINSISLEIDLEQEYINDKHKVFINIDLNDNTKLNGCLLRAFNNIINQRDIDLMIDFGYSLNKIKYNEISNSITHIEINISELLMFKKCKNLKLMCIPKINKVYGLESFLIIPHII